MVICFGAAQIIYLSTIKVPVGYHIKKGAAFKVKITDKIRVPLLAETLQTYLNRFALLASGLF